MIKALQRRNLLLLLYAMLIASLFFDALRVMDLVSISRFVSVLFMLGVFCLAGKQTLISAFRSMSLVALLLVYLLVRSTLGGFDPHDPYFYALFLNLLLAIMVVGGLRAIDRPTAVVGITFCIVAVFALCAAVGLGVEWDLQDYRATFLRLNSNEFAALMFVGLMAGLCYVDRVFSKYQRSSWLYFFGLVFIISAIFGTGTRFAILSVALSMLIYVVRVRRCHGRPELALLYCNAVIIPFLWEIIKSHLSGVYYDGAFSPTNIWGRSAMLERFDLVTTGMNHNLSSFGGRTELWLISIKAFLSAPFAGLGYEGLKAFSLAEHGSFARPHNALLEMLAIGGVLSLIFAVLMAKWLYKKVIVNLSRIEMTILMLFPVAMISMMLNVSSLKLFWVCLGIFVYWVCSPQAGGAQVNENATNKLS